MRNVYGDVFEIVDPRSADRQRFFHNSNVPLGINVITCKGCVEVKFPFAGVDVRRCASLESSVLFGCQRLVQQGFQVRLIAETEPFGLFLRQLDVRYREPDCNRFRFL